MVPESQNVPPAGIYDAQLGEILMAFEINHGFIKSFKIFQELSIYHNYRDGTISDTENRTSHKDI